MHLAYLRPGHAGRPKKSGFSGNIFRTRMNLIFFKITLFASKSTYHRTCVNISSEMLGRSFVSVSVSQSMAWSDHVDHITVTARSDDGQSKRRTGIGDH